MATYQYHENGDGTYCVSDQAGWLNGVFDSPATAKACWDKVESEKEFDNLFGDIYNAYRGNRAVTMEDFFAAFPEEPVGLTAEQRIEKVIELLHPGFWSAFDYRREAILKALDCNKSAWYKEPEEYRGR